MSEVNIIFTFENQNIFMKAFKDDKMDEIIQNFVEKVNRSKNSFIYLYEGNQIDLNMSFTEQANEKDANNNEMNILVFQKNKGEQNKNMIKGIIDINSNDINRDIALFNLEDINNEIEIYLNNKKINVLQDDNKRKYNFKKEGKYEFQIIFNNPITNMKNFFKECTNIISLDLSDFDTSNITNIESMFNGCLKLKEIKGMNKFTTNNVITMNAMFQDCSVLEYLDLSNFDTSKNINMECMFNRCYKLKEIKGINKFITNKTINMKIIFNCCHELEYLDLSSFDTSNVTSFLCMFNGCHKLKKIKGINKLITSKVTDMKRMFSQCYELEYLDLSNFNTSNVINMSLMFNKCHKLKEIKGLNKFITNKVTDMKAMFNDCYELQYLDLSNFDTSNTINFSFLFSGCLKLKEIKGINQFITNKATDMGAMFQECKELEYLDLSNFDNSNLSSINYMFYGCHKLKEIKGIQKLTANYKIDMKRMFEQCNQLDYLEVFNKDKEVLFWYNSLKSIFNTVKSNNIKKSSDETQKESFSFEIIFKADENIKDNKKNKLKIFDNKFIEKNKDKSKIIYKGEEYGLKEYLEEIDKNYNRKDIIKFILVIKNNNLDMSYMFQGCDKLIYVSDNTNSFSHLSSFNSIDNSYTFNSSSSSFIESKKCDYIMDNTNGLSLVQISTIQKESSLNINSQINDNSLINNSSLNRPIINVINLCNMFSGCNSLISFINVLKWNTSEVRNMSNVFSGCNSLKSLPDISNWDTSKVTDMSNMFNDCHSIVSLPDISRWDTSNVKDINNLFNNCNSLISIPDISKWDISHISSISYLFCGCNSLLSLPNISRWNTDNVLRINSTFCGCISLKLIPDISKWDTSKVTDMNNMFSGCTSLLSLPEISKWNISNVIKLKYMFNECYSLISLPNLSKWNISNIQTRPFLYSRNFHQ